VTDGLHLVSFHCYLLLLDKVLKTTEKTQNAIMIAVFFSTEHNECELYGICARAEIVLPGPARAVPLTLRQLDFHYHFPTSRAPDRAL